MGDDPLPGTPRSQAANTISFYTQLAFTSALLLIFLLLFCCIQRWRLFKPAFFPTTHALSVSNGARPLAGFFGWLTFVRNMKDADLLEKSGIEAYVVAHAMNLMLRFTFIMALAGCIIVIPVHVMAGMSDPEGKQKSNNHLLTIDYVPEGSRLLFIHLFLSYFFFGTFYYLLRKAYIHVIEVKNKYMLKRPSRTVMVEGLQSLRTSASNGLGTLGHDNAHAVDAELRQYFDALDIGDIEHVTIVRRCFALDYAVKERWKWLIKSERLAHQFEHENSSEGFSRLPWRRMSIGNNMSSGAETPPTQRRQQRRSVSSINGMSTPLDIMAQQYHGAISGQTVAEQANFNTTQRASDSATPTSPTDQQQQQSAAVPSSLSRRPSAPAPSYHERNSTLVRQDASVQEPGWVDWFLHMSTLEKFNYTYNRYLQSDRRVHQLRHMYDELSMPQHAAFVTFKHPASQAVASQVLLHGPLLELKVHPAPDPQSLWHSHMTTPPAEVLLRNLAISTALFFLIIFWTIPMTPIAALLNLDNITKVAPWLDNFLGINQTFRAMVKSVVATLTVTIFNGCLPLILWLLGRLRKFKTYAETYSFVFQNYFWFQIVNVLLTFVIFGSLSDIFEAFRNVSDVPAMLAKSLPGVSSFFINYTMLQAFGILPLSLLYPGRLILYLFYKYAGFIKTPRDKALAEAPDRWDTTDLAASMLILIIGLVYSLISPLILPFTAAYFGIASITYRYRLYNLYILEETQGQLWTQIVRMMHFGVLIFLLLMVGVLSLKKFWATLLFIPLFGMWSLIWVWLSKMERRMHYVPLDVWRHWTPDCEVVTNDLDYDGQCQGKEGIELRTDSVVDAYDDILLTGELPGMLLANADQLQVAESYLASCNSSMTNLDNSRTQLQPASSSSRYNRQQQPATSLPRKDPSNNV
ncbi:hypothetical protein RI367_007250 [Sorochytrium milnesiophthora]